MGRVRTITVKRAARQIADEHYNKLCYDFQINKRICQDVTVIQTKRLRNRIAGFVTHLMKRIRKGPVRGISMKLQHDASNSSKVDPLQNGRSFLDSQQTVLDATSAEMVKSLNIYGNSENHTFSVSKLGNA